MFAIGIILIGTSIKSTGANTNTDSTFLTFKIITGVTMWAIIILLVAKGEIQKRIGEGHYKQLSSKEILKKPKLLRKFAKDKMAI